MPSKQAESLSEGANHGKILDVTSEATKNTLWS